MARIDYSVDSPRDPLVAAVSPRLQDNLKSGDIMREGQRKDAEIKVISMRMMFCQMMIRRLGSY